MNIADEIQSVKNAYPCNKNTRSCDSERTECDSCVIVYDDEKDKSGLLTEDE